MFWNKERKIQENRIQESAITGNNTSLLQIGVVALAMVSFFTTANGMSQYIFSNDKPIAYAASGAVQSILLALSMNLPRYLSGIWSWARNRITKLTLCAAAIVLTIVAIFCSSWFSYVYIAETIHKDSWGVDSKLLVQQNYRSELYDARDYARAYRFYLEESMGEKILQIENQARQLPDNYVSDNVDWENEREDYVVNGGMTAASYMSTVIDAMQRALQNSSQEERDFAVTAVADAKENIEKRMEGIQQNLNVIDTNITQYDNQIASLTRRMNNAAAGTNTAELAASIDRYTLLINQLTQQQADLQTESMQLDRALLRLTYYESLLGLSSSTSAISIRSKLMQIQSEFFQQQPDEKKMLEIAQTIFEDLRNASRSAFGEENANGSEEELTYMNLLIQMNQLLRNLTEYSTTKKIEAELDDLVNELGQIDVETESGKEISASKNSSSESKEKEGEVNTLWKKRLENLKTEISAMPVYEVSEGTTEKEAGALSEAQMNILRSYDRDRSCRHLDDIIRRYLTSHNAIYAGIIYLQSPYRSLAIFALILAFSFDIAGFVFGVVIQKEEQQETQKGDNEPVFTSSEHRQSEWGILETLRYYRVLTGDYENKDEIYYYQVFDNGLLDRWDVQDEKPYKRGIYVSDGSDSNRGVAVGGEETLLFTEQPGGPVDGVYRNCRLIFDEGSLVYEREASGKEEPKRLFLANVDEHVPVHSYNYQKGENQTIPAKELDIQADVAVAALNKKGTRIAAIYIIER